MPRKKKDIDAIINAAREIEAKAAREAGALGYMARALVQTTMPHREVQAEKFIRSNGNFTLRMAITRDDVGLPYGNIPRLLLAWVATEAFNRKSRQLQLGSNITSFMRELGLVKATGGQSGSITRLKEQTNRLFHCAVTCIYDGPVREELIDLRLSRTSILSIADEVETWWNAGECTKGYVTLSDRFYREIVEHPIPIDMRALQQFKQSPMALDIYSWLTYRMSYLKTDQPISWGKLQLQFGAEYEDSPQGTRNFKKAFLIQMDRVMLLYPVLRIESDADFLYLYPSRPHVQVIDSVKT